MTDDTRGPRRPDGSTGRHRGDLDGGADRESVPEVDIEVDRELDRRLTDAGRRWRETQVLPAALSLDVPRERARRWAGPLAVAAAVAVLAGAAGVVADRLDGPGAEGAASGTRGGGGTESSGGDGSPDLRPAEVEGAVPPVDEQVDWPAAAAAGAFTPSLSETDDRPRCTSSDVVGSVRRGSRTGEVELVLRSSGTPCVVGGYASLEFRNDGGFTKVSQSQTDPVPGVWPSSVLVTPDRPAVLRTTWAGWCESTLPFDTVQTFLADEKPVGFGSLDDVNGCDEPSVVPLTDRLTYGGWEPEGWTMAPPDDFSGLDARLVATVDGPGGLPTWVVALTSPREIDLDACPSWEVRVGEDEMASWRLNCDAVPDHRADGTPYLPAGKAVRFAVWVSYADTDAPLTWVLTTPDGQVRVPLSDGPPAPSGLTRRVAEEEANVHLWLSNQSYDDRTVELVVEIDDQRLVVDSFAVGSQHTFVDYHLAMRPGIHRIVVTSDSGARLERRVEVPERGDRWGAAMYWQEGDRDPFFDWRWENGPMVWG